MIHFKKMNQKHDSITCESHIEVNHDSDSGVSSEPSNTFVKPYINSSLTDLLRSLCEIMNVKATA